MHFYTIYKQNLYFGREIRTLTIIEGGDHLPQPPLRTPMIFDADLYLSKKFYAYPETGPDPGFNERLSKSNLKNKK